MQSRRPVIVIWGDAHSEHDEHSTETLSEMKPLRTYTIGFLIAENDHGVVLCTSLWDDLDMIDRCGDYFFIPNGMIIEINEVS